MDILDSAYVALVLADMIDICSTKVIELWQIAPSDLPLFGILRSVLITLDGIVSWKAGYLPPSLT